MKELLFALLIVSAIALSSISVFAFKGNSMDYQQGSYITAYHTTNADVNDIIIYMDRRLNIFIIHRVIGLCDGGYVTKGDNNWGDDGCIPKDWIIGKVI
jgi:signal peptidase I